MTIGPIGQTEPVQNSKPNRVDQAFRAEKGDSIHISAEAKEKAEFLSALELINAAPDTSQEERIAELKAKINDPSYITSAILSMTADNIIDMLIPPKS
ncbi:MAG: flagellar biosynthesis anti-sigma factor FlgM [Spirochaetaceae bacterium]|jgi:anti-sigma28 factor (negative regulator of flagellin synthesis)|nr:flagellar biosynthesis anti-sigma factor FlgM [Spirochaetaceae bacterium]